METNETAEPVANVNTSFDEWMSTILGIIFVTLIGGGVVAMLLIDTAQDNAYELKKLEICLQHQSYEVCTEDK